MIVVVDRDPDLLARVGVVRWVVVKVVIVDPKGDVAEAGCFCWTAFAPATGGSW